MTAILGLDLSLVATGYAFNEEVVGVFKSRARGPQRLAEIRDFVLEWSHYSDVVLLEGYSYNAHNQAHQLGELGGVIRVGLWQQRTPFVEIPPAVLKRFATGRGNATKAEVLAAAIRRFDFEGDSQDAAEAWILRAMGLVHFDSLAVALPGGALEALAKVEWPVLEEVSA